MQSAWAPCQSTSNKTSCPFFIFSCTTENSNSKTIKNLHYLIKELSSDEMQGRNPGTEGAKIAKNFIASEFKKNGLTPLDKTFFQEVPAVSSLVADKSFFTVSFRDQDKKFDYGSEVVFWSKRNKEEQIIDTVSKQPLYLDKGSNGKYTTNNYWKYENEVPMCGGNFGDVVGYDTLDTAYSVYDENKLNSSINIVNDLRNGMNIKN